ncbi:alpha/beta hydrolase [Sphingomonas sp. 28-63-12]|uniref:alpha/beta hydrolase n=1 Tax=Sphingomonas sp. 28-63-12 TaxID=1970434 RepID=UPI000BDA32EB|nr:MAG: hypothetical protein B7Y47_13965 [Sphingomonas sp. 28-63-12]
MTIGRVLLGLAAAIVVALGYGYFFASPPMMLNLIDRLAPPDAPTLEIARDVNYGTAPRQQLDIWAPAKHGATKLPVVIFYYGGAWIKGSRQEYGFAGRAFAANGFIAVIPDYRLVPGVVFPTFVQDSALAVKWTRDNIARYGGDPKRITLSGHSAGAYNAAILALDPHYLRDIGVDPRVIRAAALLAGPYDFYPFDGPRSRAAFGAWPRPAETQPVTYASADAPPLFLAQGTADDVVKPRNAPRLAARLKAVGAPYVLKEYPGKSHNDLVMGLSVPFRGSATTLADSVAFLKANSQ